MYQTIAATDKTKFVNKKHQTTKPRKNSTPPPPVPGSSNQKQILAPVRDFVSMEVMEPLDNSIQISPIDKKHSPESTNVIPAFVIPKNVVTKYAFATRVGYVPNNPAKVNQDSFILCPNITEVTVPTEDGQTSTY